jgi:alpha-ketoglutarate-dependent taurine dioxygenase
LFEMTLISSPSSLPAKVTLIVSRLARSLTGSSERGVVFFRDSEITPEEQKVLVQKLGEAGGKPADSTLHIHPLTLAGSELGDEISVGRKRRPAQSFQSASVPIGKQ